MIVATYTPFGLAYWRTGGGWMLLGGLWTAAFLGFFSKVVLAHRVHDISMWTYIALGWLPLIAVPALRHTVPVDSTWWMLGGGACYLMGTLFLFYDARVRALSCDLAPAGDRRQRVPLPGHFAIGRLGRIEALRNARIAVVIGGSPVRAYLTTVAWAPGP